MDPEGSEREPDTVPEQAGRPLRILAVAVQKGGTGKTTLAASLAIAAAEAGEHVTALDLDPQGSLAGWGALRRDDSVAVDRVQPWEMGQLPEILGILAEQGTTLAVLDTAGSSAGLAPALKDADFVLMPVRPSRLDIVAARPTLQALVGLGLRERLALVLNQCPPPPSPRTGAYAAQLRALGVLAEPGIIHRVDHQDALATGLGVTEFAPGSPAAEEVRALWAWIDGKMRAAPAR
ncbi:Iron-sulfur cluster carrier protein [Methylobacterium tardum]|uniref:Chromosome partitioning protein ParA n=1 Tax=Methylobacterium tardum TaxID=374432 RepID=A0AA37T9J8_9HYPH|nr:ParA family protein [Methylobacterium tardum]URD35492.1 ParA family protein [Methylobacterium tardum]GJE50547.1 Iron-sulfur cluster carrier protein [Methylobacterium tardum]GLS69179.1 chromosome partitioning protein ParA [Methylobacterium tardum]